MMFNQVKTKRLPLTKEQEKIVRSNDQVILVDAPAGTGKSFTLMEIAQRHKNGLYLAFNKAMVQSVMNDLPVGWTCKTFNAFGLMLCRQNTKGDIKVNFDKSRLIQKRIGMDLAISHMQRAEALTDEGWKRTCDRYQVPYIFINEAIKAYNEYTQMTSIIGGEEMMYRPVINGWQSKKYDVVLVDEVQDMNPLQMEMLKLIPTNKLVLVGDSMQAISSFRGADPDIFKHLASKYHGVKYNLNVSFSCPEEVLKVIKSFVPTLQTMGPKGYVAQVRLDQAVFPSDCLILARGNSMLLQLALYLLNQGKSFSITPQTANKLKEIINHYCSVSLEEGRKLADKIYQRELATYQQHSWSTGLLTARTEGIRKLLYSFQTLDEIHNFIKSIDTYKSGTSKRRLMTIHTAKGLNHKHVFLFNPSLSAKIAQNMRKPWQQQEEKNLFYVACTRSTNGLVMVEP